jgi:rhodanese-related sulfurtransferase
VWPFRHSSSALPAPPAIDVAEAWARVRKGAHLIDVRSAHEFAAGHPKGARHLPPETIKAGDTGLASTDEILVVCLSGHRSAGEAKRLATMGYTNVANVKGGLLAWRRAGLPVTTSAR